MTESRALLLNASYEPLNVLPIRRAVNLVLADRAEVLETRDRMFGSSSFKMFEPAVLRLQYMVHPPFIARTPLNRRAVMVRDRGVCAYCHKPGSTIDHVKPRALGGLHRWENVVCACKPCNSLKGQKTLDEMGWVLKSQPYAPAGTHWLVMSFGDIDPLWTSYLDTTANQMTA